MDTEIDVSAGPEHIRKLIKPTKPFIALVELISNALDADATRVDVVIETSPLQGVVSVKIRDNGSGISRERFKKLFGELSDSWKAPKGKRSDGGRTLFGSLGQGRFRAYAIGHHVTWETVSDGPTGRVSYTITGDSSFPHKFILSDPVPTERERGTALTMLVGDASLESLNSPDLRMRLSDRYGWYLFKYPSVSIFVNGEEVTWRDALDAPLTEFAVPVAGSDEVISLTVAEWRKKTTARAILLRDSGGKIRAEFAPGLHAPGFWFTAAADWDGFRDSEVGLADTGHETFGPVLESIRAALRAYFAKREPEKRLQVIQDWKDSDIYPYSAEPATEIEAVEREIFDAIAVEAAGGLDAEERSQKLTLALLREALQTDPGNLTIVLEKVLDLPQSDIDDFAELLQRTHLSTVISAARLVNDRLTVLRSLEILLYDPQIRPAVLERTQLHRIVAAEPWIFGEQFALGVDDRGLTEVLKQHLAFLGRDELNLAHIDVDGRETARVDLMLTKTIEDSERTRHLIVELKRPSVTLGYDEETQIRRYALAVAGSPQFRDDRIGWDFVLVGTEVSRDIKKMMNQKGRERGLIYDDPEMDLRVWVRHWSELIGDRRRSLDFAKKNLSLDPDRGQAMDMLRGRFGKFVPEVVHEQS